MFVRVEMICEDTRSGKFKAILFTMTTEISISLAKCQIRLLSSIPWRIELVFIWCALIYYMASNQIAPS